MRKRLIALILTLAMVLTTVPVVALAVDTPSVSIVDAEVTAFECEGYTSEDHNSGEEYVHYSVEPHFIVDTDDGQTQVGPWESFTYQGVEYMITAYLYDANDEILNESSEKALAVGTTYNGKAQLEIIGVGSEGDPINFTFEVCENPVESVTLESYSESAFVGTNQCQNGIWDDDQQDWTYYDVYSITPVKATIVFKDSYVEELGESAVINPYNGPSYLTIRGKDYSLNFDWGSDEQSPTHSWGIGDHTATVSFMGTTLSQQYTYSVLETPIESITIDDIEIIEGCYDAYGSDDNTGNGHYFVNPLRLGSNTQIATVTIKEKYKDEVTYNKAMNQLNYGDQCYYFTVDDPQDSQDPWGIGSHTVTASLLGYTATFNVNIVESPITSYTLKDKEILQYSNGEYRFDDNGNAWFKYNTDWFALEVDTIETTDDSVQIQTDVDTGKTPGVWYKENYYEPSMSFEQSVDNQLEVGTQTVNTTLMGVDGTVKFTLVEPTITDRIESIEFDDYIEIEETQLGIGWSCNGDEDWTPYTSITPKFTVHYKDGSVGYGYGNTYRDAKDNTDYTVGLYIEGQEDLDPYEDDSLDWEVGSVHNAKMYFLGKAYEFKVKVVPSKITEAEILDSITVPSDTENVDDIVWQKVDDLRIKFTYSDGTTEIKKFSEQSQCVISANGEGFFLADSNKEYDELQIIYKDSEISSVEIDPSSVGKAYWGKALILDDTYEYEYDPYGTIVNVTFDNQHKETVKVNAIDGSEILVYNGITYKINLTKASRNEKLYLKASIGSASDEVEVPFAPKSVTVKSVTLVSEPTVKYYLNDYFNECANTDYRGLFTPIEFTGLKIKVTMTDNSYFYIDGDNFTSRNESTGITSYYDGCVSDHHIAIMKFKNQTTTSADLCVQLFGETYDVGYTFEKEESPYKSISLVEAPDKEKLEAFDGSGITIRIEYKDGSEAKEVTLGSPIKSSFSDSEYTCGMNFGTYAMGDGFEYFGFDSNISGIRMNAYYLGDGEYVSIIWNNNMLRFCDQMISLDPDKWTTVNGNANVEIDTATLSNAVINSLGEDDAYAVAEQGASLYNNINVDEVKPSSKITVQANKDDTEIKSCYDINFSYLVQGEEYQLTELENGKISVTILLDESLWGADKEDIVLYREHEYADGTKVEQITDFTISEDGKYITFESDKFSTFAIGLSDETPTSTAEDEEIADTSDPTQIAATVMLLWSSGLCSFAVTKKRKELEN